VVHLFEQKKWRHEKGEPQEHFFHVSSTFSIQKVNHGKVIPNLEYEALNTTRFLYPFRIRMHIVAIVASFFAILLRNAFRLEVNFSPLQHSFLPNE
jgi:hypothetical protein